MKRSMKIILIVACMALLGSAVAFAEKTEWKNAQYNTSHITKIAILCEIPPDSLKSVQTGYTDRICADFLRDWCTKQQIAADTLLVIENKLAQVNPEYSKLKTTDADHARDVLLEYVRAHYSTILQANILRYGFDSIYHEGYTYTTTSIESIKTKKSDGTWVTTEYPVTKTNYSEPYTTSQAVVYVEFSLDDARTKEIIFARSEERRSDGGLFSSPKVENVLNKVCEGYIKDLKKMIRP